MSLLNRYLVQEVVKVATKRNVAGDVIIDATKQPITLGARFRVIENISNATNRDEQRSDQAMIWFAADAPIDEFDVVTYEGKYWQITRRTEARRLGGRDIQFLKCFASRFEVVS